jgi:hypothetical protein
MSVLRSVALSLSTLFGRQSVLCGLVASSYPTSLRVGGAFLGCFSCCWPWCIFASSFPHAREEIVRSDQVG